MKMLRDALLRELTDQIGNEVHVSDWITVTQDCIDAFAEATGDRQWIHVNAKRARRESPYGTSIAHGYLLLALYPVLRGAGGDEPPYAGVRNIINYGLNRVRFPDAVRAGERVRGRFQLLEAMAVGEALQLVERFTLELEGGAKPACVAETVRRLYFRDSE